MFENEDEKKKREEEARNIISSLNPQNSNGSAINFVNYSNDNNYKINVNNEDEQSYIDKINEANSIINSINPREEGEIPEPTEEEREESRKNTQELLNLIDNGIEETIDTKQQEEVNQFNITSDTRINGTKTKEEIEKQVRQASIQGAITENKQNNQSSNTLIDKDVKIGLASTDETANAQELTTLDVKAMNEANQKNKNIEKGSLSKFEEVIDTVLDNIYGGVKQTVSGLANILTSAVAFGIRGLEGATKIIGLDEQAQTLNNTYNSIVDLGSSINETATYEQNINSQVNDNLIQTAGEVTSTISNMVSSTVIGYALPANISSTTVMGLSAGGNAAQEVLDENKDNIGQATLTGLAKGYSSYLTEKMFDANILTRGEKKSSIQEGINRLIANNITSKFGKEFANSTVGIIGENIEEIVDNNAGYLIDKLVNNKDLPDFKQWLNEQSETIKTTTLSTMIMSLLGLGGTSFKEIEGDMNAEYWIDQAQQIIDQENLAIHFNPNEVKNINDTNDFYITRFTPDGEIANIVPTKGKTIYNSKSELNVSPVIILDSETNMYNVIDGNTGVVLDSTPYSTTMEAEGGFNEKINKLSDLQVKDINTKISKADYMITNEIMNVVTQAQEQLSQMTLADYGINTGQNTEQNYEQERQKQNFESINKTINQISDKSVYNQTAVNNLLNMVSNNIKNIEYVQDDNGRGTLYSFDNDKNITGQQNINNRPYTGKRIKNIVNTAIQNADISNLYQDKNANNIQTSSESNKSNFYTNQSNNYTNDTGYAVQDIKRVTEAFDNQESYSRNEMADIWNNDVFNNNYDAYYDSNGNIERYIAIEEEGNNIVVNQYDNNDNIVKSEVIPNENGRYTASDIQDTINRVASLYDENRPIKGQQDIEGNEVLSMKKNSNQITISHISTFEKEINQYKEKSKKLNKIDRNIVEINTNILDGISKKKQSNFINEYLKNEVKGQDYFVNNQKIIANNTTIGKLKNGKTNFDQRINKKIMNELKYNVIGNIQTIVENSKIYQKNLPDKKDHSFADTFDRRKTIFKYKNQYYEVMFEIGKKKNINTLYSIEKIKKTSSPTQINKNLRDTKKGIGSTKSNKSISQNTKSVKKNASKSNKTSNDDNVRTMKKTISKSNAIQTNTTVDNQGRTLSKQQQEYFKNSKVRDDNGNLQTVYHTSKESFTIFNPVGTEHYRFGNDSVNYFTDNKVMSLSYEKETPNLYEGYLNITNPYVIDAKGAEWNKVSKSIDKTLLNKISNISTDLKQEIINKAKETNNKKVELWDNYQNEVDKIYSLKKELTQPGEYISIDELENNINNKQPSQRTMNEKEYLRLRKKSEQLYSDYNEYDGKSEFYNYFENNNEFDNIINSLTYKQKNNVKTVSRDEFYEIAKLGFDPQNIADRFEYFETTNDIVFKVLDENKTRKQKYDGVIIKNVIDYADYSNYDGTGNIFVVFNSNQFKNADNIKPTSNQDIRFAKKTVKPVDEVLEPGQRNAERDTNYIEQEIRKIEQTGNWDDSIPVTKMTDIRKTIEDYLGIGVQKGRFRQQAYGIYKGTRDVIRTKELKDIDTILHETGHALDIGNRIKINKEAISNELLKAVNNYGGYEAETREIQLEEGFAEVIREYTIVPEQARIDYPQTVSILEGIRQENKDFDNFIRNVQEQTYNYIHQNPRNRTLSNVSIGEQTDKRIWTKASTTEAIMRAVYDKDWSLKSAVNELQKVQGKTTQDLRASENAYYLTRLSSGVGGKITSMLSNGYIDENGNKLMPGLNQLGEILGNEPSRFDDLRAYLVAQRDLEYKAKTLKTGIRTMDSKAVVAQFKNDTQIQEASKLVYDTLDGVMQYAVNNGLITQENADSLRESNVFYVPMQRVLEGNKNNVGRRGAVVDVIKARTGSELDVKDVLENIVSNSANIIQQVENNNILKALYKQGEQAGITGKIYDVISTPMVKVGTAKLSTWESELKNQGVDITDVDFDKTIDLFAPNNKIDSKNLITSFINDDGKRVYLQFNDDVLFNSLMNIDRKFMSTVLNINRKFNMPLRYGATMANIGFAIPNVISDTAQASIFSDAGFIPVVDNLIGVMDIVSAQNREAREFFNKIMPGYADRINTMYALYEQSGATSSTRMSQYRESTQVLMKDVYGTKNSEVLGIKEKYKPLKRLLDIMTYIPDISEQSTRFRIFEKNLEYYRRNGIKEMDARIQSALQSRDATQDFGRTGNITREINQLIPFSAARVGSAYTFAEKVKANPKRTVMRLSILTAVAMAIKTIGYDDDEIEELNQRKKNDNFVLKIGDEIVTIKKPQGILRSIVNLTEYIQDLFTGHIEEGKEGERLAELVQSAIMDNMPADSVTGLVPNMVAPVVENAINKDLYYNSDIVKSYDLELPDSEQYYDYNSQLAIWLGQIFNYSPAKIDNLISGYFAGLGTSVTNVIDWISGKIGITAEQPEMGAEDNAVAKRFIVNVNSNSASVDEVYDLKTELTKKKNGDTITSEESQKLEDVTNATSEMAKLNKQIKEIKKDLTISGKEKADQIKLLQQQKVDTARKALGKDVLYSENETNIESTTFYPSRDILSQNGYTLNLTSDMKKEYEELAYNKYKEYENQGLYSEEKLESLREKCKDYAKSQLLKKYKNDLIKKSE